MAGSAQHTPGASPQGEADGPPPYRGLKAAVIIMGVLLVVGFIVVFATIVQRAGNLGTDRVDGESAPASLFETFETVRSTIPPDATIGTMALDGDRLAVQLRRQSGSEIIVFDVARGREAGRIVLAPE